MSTPMSSPEVSIIVVSFNGRDHLARCLETLARQRAAAGTDAFEVLVVDNASTDGSAELVRTRHPEVRLIELPANVGFGTANNRGVAAAHADRLLLLNSDAWLADDALPRLVAALDRDPRLALVAPQLRYPDGRLQFVWVPESGVVGEAIQMVRNRFEGQAWNHRLVPPPLRFLTGPGWYSAACLLLRRAAYEAIGGFDEEIFLYFEDVDLGRRLHRAGWTARLVPEAHAIHVKGGSRSSDVFELGYRRGQLYYYDKHRPAWERRLLRAKLRRKFQRATDPDFRRRLLALLEPPP